MTENHRNSIEGEERQDTRREIEIHVFRHGKPVGYSANSGITEESAQKAFQVGQNLIEEIGPGESIKFYSSHHPRALETREKIQEGLGEVIEESGKKIHLYKVPRTKRDVRVVKMERGTEWFNQFAASRDPIRFWLEHPSEQTEDPKAVLERFQHFITHMERLADRLSIGPKIHIIVVTHSAVTRPFLQSEFGSGTGNDLGYCEAFNLTIPSQRKNPLVIDFGDRSKEASFGQKQE